MSSHDFYLRKLQLSLSLHGLLCLLKQVFLYKYFHNLHLNDISGKMSFLYNTKNYDTHTPLRTFYRIFLFSEIWIILVFSLSLSCYNYPFISYNYPFLSWISQHILIKFINFGHNPFAGATRRGLIYLLSNKCCVSFRLPNILLEIHYRWNSSGISRDGQLCIFFL